MRVAVVQATQEHADIVGKNMRAEDAAEVLAMSGRDPMSAIQFSMAQSDFAMAGLIDGHPICIFGAGTANLLTGVGVPWLLGTNDVKVFYRQFSRSSRFWVEQMRGRYSYLMNAVDDRNTLSKRWLSWLGFKLHDPVPMGVKQLPFRIFEMRADHV